MDQSPLILIVDDEGYFREIFSTKLSAAGYRVDTAQDGKEAVEKAKQLKPALILMDVRMPIVNGVEAVLTLKGDPETKDLKVVFLTNLGEAQADMQQVDQKISKETGAAGYIKKSDDLDAVVNQIKGYLQ